MATLTDPAVARLLAEPNHAVVSTINPNGSVLSTVVWIDHGDGVLAVNGAVGRRWPTNLQQDPRIAVVVDEQADPDNLVEIRGTASGSDR